MNVRHEKKDGATQVKPGVYVVKSSSSVFRTAVTTVKKK